GGARALPQPVLECGHDRRLAAGERLDLAVRAVADPAREPQAPCLVAGRVAKAHTLNHAGDDEAPANAHDPPPPGAGRAPHVAPDDARPPGCRCLRGAAFL